MLCNEDIQVLMTDDNNPLASNMVIGSGNAACPGLALGDALGEVQLMEENNHYYNAASTQLGSGTRAPRHVTSST